MRRLRKTNQIILFVIFLIVVFASSYEVVRNTYVPPPEATAAASASPPRASAVPSPTPEPNMDPFSIIWIADTQTMVYREYKKPLRIMGEWIAKQKEEQNAVYIIHTGDAVDNGLTPDQWKTFDILYDQFRGVMPYIPVAGNHDLGVKVGDYSAYLQRPYVRDYPKERSYGGGKAVYDTFSAGGTDFLLAGLGWDAGLGAELWINQVLKAHPNHVAILLTHSYIKANGSFAEFGQEIHDRIVSKNPNIRLVLSGHVRGSGIRTEEFDDNDDDRADRVVNALLYNYQHYDRNCGQLRTLTFDPVERSIRVVTYSPYTKIYYNDGHFRKPEFTLENAF